MGLEGLTELQIFQGFMGLVSLSITVIVAIKIASKYFTYERIELLTVGLMMIFITSGWWGSTSAFILYVFFDTELSDFHYLFLSYVLLPLPNLLWIYSFAQIFYQRSKWKLVLIWLVISIVYEIFFFIFIFTDTTLIGTRVGIFDAVANTFIIFFILLSFLISIITNIMFLRASLRSAEAEIRWKGKFIFITFVVYVFATILDSAIPLNTISLFKTRMLLIFSTILGYIGWTMPDRVARWLIKDS